MEKELYRIEFTERIPLYICRECGGEVFHGEVYYDVAGRLICRDCLPHFARRYFGGCRRVLKTPEGCR